MRVGASLGIPGCGNPQSWDPQDSGKGGAGWDLRDCKDPVSFVKRHIEAPEGEKTHSSSYGAGTEQESWSFAPSPEPDLDSDNFLNPKVGAEGPGDNRVGPGSWVQGLLLGSRGGLLPLVSSPCCSLWGDQRLMGRSQLLQWKKKDNQSCIYSSFLGARQVLFTLQSCELQKGRASMFLPTTTVPQCPAQGLAHKRSFINVD